MAQLSILTILVLTAANLFMVAAALVLIMGPRVSPAARYAQGSVLAQALSWAAIIASGYVLDPLLSTLALAGAGASQWLLHRALAGWLGPRPGGRLLAVLCIALPLGYAALFASYPLRVGWSNFLLAAQLLIVARATLRPLRQTGARWRWLLLGCLLAMALVTAARGVLGAFFTDLYPTFRTPHPVNIAAQLVANFTLVLGTVAMLVAWREEAEDQLRELAMTDGLTGVLNRRGFDARAAELFSSAQRHKLTLAVLMLDLDHFKRINDARGHDAGDRALRLFARLLRDCRRGDDLVGRRGGEEFCVLLTLSDAGQATGFERRLRARLPHAAQEHLDFDLDYSAGLAVRKPGESSLEQVVARADAALYRAKQNGRGRLELAP